MSLARWFTFLGAAFLFGVISGNAYVMGFSAALSALFGVASWWRKHSLDGVVYRRFPYYRRAFPGESVPLKLTIANNKPLPLSWLRSEDPWPLAIGPEDDQLLAPSHIPEHGLLTNVFSLRWFEKTSREYMLRFRKRGHYKVGPVNLHSGDAFGIFEHSRKAGQAQFLTVFPEVIPLEALNLPAEDPFGTSKSRRRIFEDPNQPMGIREYRTEDEFRRVHWPATARTGQLQVKVFQPTSAQVAQICLNTSTIEDHFGVYPELFEYLVSVAATLTNHYFNRGYQVGLMSNGFFMHSHRPINVPPGRSMKQLGVLLEVLAGITPLFSIPFEDYLIREMPRVPYGASLLIVTAVTPPVLLETLAKLERHNRKVTLLSLAQKLPEKVAGLDIIHRPYQRPAGREQSLYEDGVVS